jgi:hypothetical protein
MNHLRRYKKNLVENKQNFWNFFPNQKNRSKFFFVFTIHTTNCNIQIDSSGFLFSHASHVCTYSKNLWSFRFLRFWSQSYDRELQRQRCKSLQRC